MKRLFVALFLLCSVALSVAAQDILDEVKRMKDNYQSEKNNTTKSIEERRIATFKYDAIWYLLDNADNETERELGAQVAAMTDFVNLFLIRVKEAKGNQKRQAVIVKFKNASLGNALYHDNDKELVYAYVDNDNFLTQFSLDTDWVKALDEVRE